MQKQEFEERIERTVTDEQYKVIEEVSCGIHLSGTHPAKMKLLNCIRALV